MFSFQENIAEIQINVDPKFHRHFVVRRGEVLHKIAMEYGNVSVSFPRSGTNSDKVTLKGAKECVEGAKNRILEIVADLVSIDNHGFFSRSYYLNPPKKKEFSEVPPTSLDPFVVRGAVYAVTSRILIFRIFLDFWSRKSRGNSSSWRIFTVF